MTDAKIKAIRPAAKLHEPSLDRIKAILLAAGVVERVAVIGWRGYGAHFDADTSNAKNRIGVYDDLLIIVTPQFSESFLGNTDPSTLIPGRAVLQPGKYRYTRGIHGLSRAKEKQYAAWVQAGGVDIRRQQQDGTMGPLLKNQWIGCNIHNGSWTTTGSAACQTIAPERWPTFDAKLAAALKGQAQTKFWYVLTEEMP